MQKKGKMQHLLKKFYWYCLKHKDFFASFRSSSWTARWERQGLQISDCGKAEQPWIESVSICWQLSKFVLYVTQQSRDWRVRVNCGYVNMCPGNKFVNCSTCTILVLKRGFWNFFFFLFPFGFGTVDCPYFTFKSVDSTDTTRIFLDVFVHVAWKSN